MTDKKFDHPYSDQETDFALRTHLRSDWLYILIRLTSLTVVFAFIARAIIMFDLPAGLVVIPLIFDYLAVVWLGLGLSRFVIDCDAFRQKNASSKVAVSLSLLVTLAILIALAAKDGSFSIARIPHEWSVTWQACAESGLLWGIAANTVGLLIATVPDVTRWRKSGGKFVWGANIQNSVRFATIVIAIFPVMFLGAWANEASPASISGAGQQLSWIVFGCLLSIKLLTLVISVGMHRDLSAQLAEDSRVKARDYGADPTNSICFRHHRCRVIGYIGINCS